VASVEEPASFLDRVAVNLARDHLRQVAVQHGSPALALEHLACDEPDPERVCLDRERVRRAEQALAAMPPRRREVFLAARLEGLPHAAIAARFGITPAAVQKHVARALVTLAAALANEHET
jgi:RNA polymerase sigma-70 factor (ECF subfamily)